MTGRVSSPPDITVCPDFPDIHRCKNRLGCVNDNVQCRHCGDIGPRGTDHTCPCPYRDEECPDHG